MDGKQVVQEMRALGHEGMICVQQLRDLPDDGFVAQCMGCGEAHRWQTGERALIELKQEDDKCLVALLKVGLDGANPF